MMKKTMIAVVAAALALAGCRTTHEYDNSTKVLMIGNSFSISLMPHMPKVASAMAIDLDLTSLYIGGCTLKRHMDNVKRDGQKDADGRPFAPYAMTRNFRGKDFHRTMVNVTDVLKGEKKFDIITIQQGSHESWQPDCYHPYGDELVATIRKYQPQAKIVVQETWSYTPWDKRLARWGIDQNEMYARLHAAYADFAKIYGFDVIPMGTAIQLWRQRLPVRYTERSFGGDVVGGRRQKKEDQFKRMDDNTWKPNCDVFHLSDAGEYFQALVWTAFLFNEDVNECDYCPDFVSESDAKLMKEIANELRRR